MEQQLHELFVKNKWVFGFQSHPCAYFQPNAAQHGSKPIAAHKKQNAEYLKTLKDRRRDTSVVFVF